jgi:predicted O-methyltransferase YrrM
MGQPYPNWFGLYADGWFERHLRPLADKPLLRCLQIGAFTGDASLWLLRNLPNCTVVDVDTWEGSDEIAHKQFDWADVEHVYDERTATARKTGRLVKWKLTSELFFSFKPGPFDFIYIDGDHTSYGVLNDAVSAYKVLAPGGLLAFDDYRWQSGKTVIHDPKFAIDAIGAIYEDRLELIELAEQAWFRRIA